MVDTCLRAGKTTRQGEWLRFAGEASGPLSVRGYKPAIEGSPPVIKIPILAYGAMSAAFRRVERSAAWAITVAAVSAGSLLAGFGSASVQAAVASSAATHIMIGSGQDTRHVGQPLYTCPSRSFCLFKGANLTGIHKSWNTNSYGGHWIDLHSYNIIPHRSVNNNSGSDVWLLDETANREFCVKPGARGNFTGKYLQEEINSGWMWIRYGVNNCNNPPPHGP